MRFDVIVADPAWEYGDDTRNKLGSNKKHYPSMPHDQMARLDVASLSKPDTTLFMWTTAKMMPEALKLIAAWGFKYQTVAFVWEKLHPTTQNAVAVMSMWTHSCFEFVLVAKRGKHKRVGMGVKQHIRAPRGEHSAKPDESYRRIEALMGRVSYVELFARRTWPGWRTWGNAVPNTIALPCQVGD